MAGAVDVKKTNSACGAVGADYIGVMARVSFKKLIAQATSTSGWENTQTFEGDCNCILESLVADLSLEDIVAAVDRQGFRGAHEYGRAAEILKGIAEERRLKRRAARDEE